MLEDKLDVNLISKLTSLSIVEINDLQNLRLNKFNAISSLDDCSQDT